jgi:hypothetical protein
VSGERGDRRAPAHRANDSLLTWRADGLLVPIVSGVFFSGVAAFLLTRPNPTASKAHKGSATD